MANKNPDKGEKEMAKVKVVEETKVDSFATLTSIAKELGVKHVGKTKEKISDLCMDQIEEKTKEDGWKEANPTLVDWFNKMVELQDTDTEDTAEIEIDDDVVDETTNEDTEDTEDTKETEEIKEESKMKKQATKKVSDTETKKGASMKRAKAVARRAKEKAAEGKATRTTATRARKPRESSKPGVISTIIEIGKGTKKGFTIDEYVEKLKKGFPDRDAEGMKSTCKIQLGGRLKERDMKVIKEDGRYRIETA